MACAMDQHNMLALAAGRSWWWKWLRYFVILHVDKNSDDQQTDRQNQIMLSLIHIHMCVCYDSFFVSLPELV